MYSAQNHCKQRLNYKKNVIYFKVLKLSCIHILKISCIYMAIHGSIAIAFCTWLKVNGAVSKLSYCAYFLRENCQNTVRFYESSICKKYWTCT